MTASKVALFAVLGCAALALGCGGTTQPYVDTHIDLPDTAVDTGWDIPDVPPDTGWDTGYDTGSDTGSDTLEETAADTGFDTGYDTGWDTGWDTGFDTGWDTGYDPGWDTGVDTGVDTGTDTSTDPGVDTGPMRVVGLACTYDTDCGGVPGAGRTCIISLFGYVDFPGGYCSATCTTAADCGTLGSCVNVLDYGQYCLRNCSAGADCRQAEGYACSELAGSPGATYCIPPTPVPDGPVDP